MRRRVTFSRNVTLSLSRTCRCHCKYCAFATHQAHLHEPDEVEGCSTAPRAGGSRSCWCSPASSPRSTPGSRERLREWGFEDFVAYVRWACERALERGLLPHTNLGVLSRDDLARLREVTASQGLMLESVRSDLVVHQGSPTKAPGAAPGDDPLGRRAADPVHERDPGGHRRVRGGPRRGARGAGRGARRARPPPGGDPAELRSAPPLLRRGAGRDRRRGRRASTGARGCGDARTAPRRLGDAGARSTT